MRFWTPFWQKSQRHGSPAETFATTNRVVIGGEVGLSDKEKLSSYMGRIDEIARACIKDIGYEQDKFHHETVEVTNLLHEQSAHIAQGVDAADNKDEGRRRSGDHVWLCHQ
jgi:S-adenosylmethionine synthetase